jgi:diacylglycerol kinase family enzyme
MKVTLIHNEDAGTDESHSAAQLLRLVRAAGHTVIYHPAKDLDWCSALKAATDLVAVAGGDGTVGKAAKSAMACEIAVPIAVLPLGTANNIATALGLANYPLEELIASWSSARRVPFDIGVVRGPTGLRHFIEGLGIGLFAETMYRLDARNNIDLAHLETADEKIASVLHMLDDRLHHFPAKELQISLDGHDLSGAYILVEIMNVSHIGPNLCLALEADPSDGLLDIALVSIHEREQLSQCLRDSKHGKLTGAALTVRQGRQLKIRWDRFPIHIDDQVWPDHAANSPPLSSPLDVRVQHDALQFLMPNA